MAIRLRTGITPLLLAGVLTAGCRSSRPEPSPHSFPDRSHYQYFQGGIIRGDPSLRTIALAFTAHQFAEGADPILRELKRHHAKASFFLTGEFVQTERFHPIIRQIAAEGHYFGAHSDQHLLYCSWDRDRHTLVTQEQFVADVMTNLQRFDHLTLAAKPGRYFLPPFEHYNPEIADWTQACGLVLINYTPGTRSHADYTGEADRNFVSSQAIYDSIVKHEQADPHGLNGFILLLHLGSGPGRTDKFPARFGELLDYLAGRGYEFVRVDELLAPAR